MWDKKFEVAFKNEFRKTNKNMGIDKWQIPTELRYLLDDIRYWHSNNTYPPDELAFGSNIAS